MRMMKTTRMKKATRMMKTTRMMKNMRVVKPEAEEEEEAIRKTKENGGRGEATQIVIEHARET